jgi:protein-tyrosine phosphatase
MSGLDTRSTFDMSAAAAAAAVKTDTAAAATSAARNGSFIAASVIELSGYDAHGAAVHGCRLRMYRTRRMQDSVLFVCLGNICRSPTAEGVFRARIKRAGLSDRIAVASAGTGDWHVGEPPDRRAIAHAAKRGYDLRKQRARQLCEADFERFNWILAMDRANLRDVSSQRPFGYDGRVGLFLEMAPHLGVAEVPDPYYGATDGFERVLDLIEAASDSLLARIIDERSQA